MSLRNLPRAARGGILTAEAFNELATAAERANRHTAELPLRVFEDVAGFHHAIDPEKLLEMIPSTGSITVEAVDGSPYYSGITSILFDEADGFALSQPTAGQVRVDFPGGSGVNESCLAYHSSDQSITSASPLVLAFNSEYFDTSNFHDVSTNNSRLTIPTTGRYLIGYTLHVGNSSNSGTSMEIYIRLNGSTYLSRNHRHLPDAVNTFHMALIWQFTAGDYVELYGTASAVANPVVAGTASLGHPFAPNFWAERLT